jgi:hypothetical protein
MKGKIVAVFIIAIILIAGLLFIFMNKDNTWITDWTPSGEISGGSWGEQIILTYEDGSKETLNNILGNTGPLSVSYGGNVITAMAYVLNGKASQTGSDYNEVIVDFIGGKLSSNVISNVGYVTLWDFNSDGIINSVDISSVTGKIGQTGAPGWIKEDINYDGSISSLDTAILQTHYGAVTGGGLMATMTSAAKTGTNTIPLTGTWTQLYSADLDNIISYANNQADGTYVFQLKMTSGTPRYRAHNTASDYYSDWISASYPWDRDIVVTVSHGTLTFIFGNGFA